MPVSAVFSRRPRNSAKRSIAEARIVAAPAVTTTRIAPVASTWRAPTGPRRRASSRIAAAATQMPPTPVIAPEMTSPSPPATSAAIDHRCASGGRGEVVDPDERGLPLPGPLPLELVDEPEELEEAPAGRGAAPRHERLQGQIEVSLPLDEQWDGER